MHDLGDSMDATTTGTEDPHKGARNAINNNLNVFKN